MHDKMWNPDKTWNIKFARWTTLFRWKILEGACFAQEKAPASQCNKADCGLVFALHRIYEPETKHGTTQIPGQQRLRPSKTKEAHENV